MGDYAEAWQKATEAFNNSGELIAFMACMDDGVIWHSEEADLTGKRAVLAALEQFRDTTGWSRHEIRTPIVEAEGFMAYVFRNSIANGGTFSAGAVGRTDDRGMLVELWTHRDVQ